VDEETEATEEEDCLCIRVGVLSVSNGPHSDEGREPEGLGWGNSS
jgi:hypothetical protein